MPTEILSEFKKKTLGNFVENPNTTDQEKSATTAPPASSPISV